MDRKFTGQGVIEVIDILVIHFIIRVVIVVHIVPGRKVQNIIEVVIEGYIRSDTFIDGYTLLFIDDKWFGSKIAKHIEIHG